MNYLTFTETFTYYNDTQMFYKYLPTTTILKYFKSRVKHLRTEPWQGHRVSSVYGAVCLTDHLNLKTVPITHPKPLTLFR